MRSEQIYGHSSHKGFNLMVTRQNTVFVSMYVLNCLSKWLHWLLELDGGSEVVAEYEELHQEVATEVAVGELQVQQALIRQELGEVLINLKTLTMF